MTLGIMILSTSLLHIMLSSLFLELDLGKSELAYGFRNIFFSRNGWVGVLAGWKQDPNILVNLPATKALCNLDQEFGVHR